MTELTQEQIEAIQAYTDAATPGPWYVVENKSFGVQAKGKNIASCFRRENEQFIARARTDVPALLSYIAAVTSERDALKKDLETVKWDGLCAVCRYSKVNGYVSHDFSDDLCCQCKNNEHFTWRGTKKEG